MSTLHMVVLIIIIQILIYHQLEIIISNGDIDNGTAVIMI